MNPTIRQKVDAIVLAEGLHRDGEEFHVDLERDYASDVVFFNKPKSGPDWFAGFSISGKATDKASIKDALKYMTKVEGDWEGMLDLAAKNFAENHDLSIYDAVITPHEGGHHALLANLLLASLEQYLSPDTVVLRGGMVKDLKSVGVDWDKAIEMAPAKNTDDQTMDFLGNVEQNFNSAMNKARQTGNFRIRSIRPQFRKFIKGLIKIPAHSNVLIVDDVRTTGTTLRMAQEYLEGEVEDPNVFLFTLL